MQIFDFFAKKYKGNFFFVGIIAINLTCHYVNRKISRKLNANYKYFCECYNKGFRKVVDESKCDG